MLSDVWSKLSFVGLEVKLGKKVYKLGYLPSNVFTNFIISASDSGSLVKTSVRVRLVFLALLFEAVVTSCFLGVLSMLC